MISVPPSSPTNLMKKLQAISSDRISALPEPIIHRILSRLPTKSVKLATSLSKTWYDFCSSFPYLDFDDYSFEEKYADQFIYNDDDFDSDWKPIRKRYLNYIGETLRRFHDRNPKILIHRLSISVNLISNKLVSQFGNLIQFAFEHGVEKLDLLTRGYYFNLPGEVFASSSIRVLNLQGFCWLKTFRNGDIGVTNSKLRKLFIEGVDIDELALRSVISNFPLMEKLEIEGVKGLTNLGISGLNKLQSLVINNSYSGDIEMVEVHAPVLHCLELCTKYHRPLFKIGTLECPRLAKLILSGAKLENFQLEEILSRLPSIRSLSLTKLFSLTKFKISSNSLSQLVVVRCTDLVEVEINAPNLLSFEFDNNSVPLVRPMHTIMGQSRITLNRKPSSYDNFGVKFRNFLSRLDHVNYLSFHLHDLAMISIDEPEERVVQPLTNIEELKVTAHNSNDFQDIFNDLLWSYHPRTLRMEATLIKSDDVMTFLRAIMAGADSCCSSVYARSWRPYLEEITIVVDNDNVIKLPMDGTVPSIAVKGYIWGNIKFAFKW